MSKRRPGRPNCIDPEVWNNFSQDEQVQWWKDRWESSAGPPNRDPARLIALYDDGTITRQEFTVWAFEWMTPDNVRRFLAACPGDRFEDLRDHSDRLPADDDDHGWSSLVTISSILYAPWVTPEEIHEAKRARDARYREGVQVFRQAIDSESSR